MTAAMRMLYTDKWFRIFVRKFLVILCFSDFILVDLLKIVLETSVKININ